MPLVLRVRKERKERKARKVRWVRPALSVKRVRPALRVLLVPSSQLGKASGIQGRLTALVTLLFIPTPLLVLV